MCGQCSNGNLDGISDYRIDLVSHNNKSYTKLVYPEDIQEWYPILINSILKAHYKGMSKDLTITLIIGKPKNEDTCEFYKGNVMVGIADKWSNEIDLIVSNTLFSNLKKSKFNKGLSSSVVILIDYICHELYHIKCNRGKNEIDQELLNKIGDRFFKDLYEEDLE